MSPSLRRCVHAAALGAELGVLAASLGALSDYGAHWLWLEGARDRIGLLACLVGFGVPCGALVGMVLGGVFAAGKLLAQLAARTASADRRSAWRRVRIDALFVTAVASPALVWLARSLFKGGKMARLPGKPFLECGVVIVLLASGYASLVAGERALAWLEARDRGRVRAAVGLVLLGFAIDKLNQWFLPGLYDNIHAALVALAFGASMCAFFSLRGVRSRGRARPGLSLLVGSVLAFAILSATLARLDSNQNVRVALLSSSVPHSRALLQLLGPLVIEPAQQRAIAEARLRGKLARARHARVARASVGPTLDDAHVLLITVDALRPDHLGAYGYKRPTSPELDRFASESVLFERVYAPAPHSSYSLCSLMTSEYLHETLDLGQALPKQTLATVMAQAGYHTAAFYSEGIFHTAAERLQPYEQNAFGFALHDQVTYPAEQLTERVLQEVGRTKKRGEPNSFFWVHYFDVHEPYLSTHFGSAAQDRYDSEILHVDHEIARLVREVRKRLTRPVIVAISADHGEEFYEHGGVYHGSSLYEEQVRVPLLLNAPGFAPRRVSLPVKGIDLAPTLLALVGLDAPASMRGDDLRGLALGHDERLGPAYAAVIHKKMVVRWPYKLIADLRFGSFELYDLEHDPHERENLADARPELLADLKQEVYAWLDGLADSARADKSALANALDWGRVGDRRAVEPLTRLLADRAAPSAERAEAARILGRLTDERASDSLVAALADRAHPEVSAEAAIALGRMYDPRAHEALLRLVHEEDPQLRTRAAVSLARLRDRRAVPSLIDALYVGRDDYERQEAVRWLGRLRDSRAIPALLETLPERRTRYLIPIALGMIGDPRAYAPLIELLQLEPHPDVRDATVQGLGLLADPRAIELVTDNAVRDPSLKLATEALVRMGAIERAAIGGTDLVSGASALDDFEACVVGPLRHDWDFQHRTTCVTKSAVARLRLQVPASVASAEGGVIVALSIKRSDANSAAPLELSLGGRVLAPIHVDGAFAEYRWSLAPHELAQGTLEARISSVTSEARFDIDHLLLLPLVGPRS